MEKALEIGKTSATGSFQLLIGVALSTIIMAAGTIIVGRLLTPDEYGLYGIVLVPSTLVNLFRDWGINAAMTKYIASLRVSHQDEEMRDVIVAGLTFEFVSGLALSFLSLSLASFIAIAIFQRPESTSYIAIISVAIVSGSLFTASQAIFVGFERMELNSLTLIVQSIIKTAIGPILIFFGYSVLGAVIGYTASFIAAGTMGLATFYFVLFRPLRKKRLGRPNLVHTLRKMLGYGVPLQISSIFGGILTQVFALIVPSFVSNTMYGNYLTALNFSVLITFLTVPISTVLFPAFAKLDQQNGHELVKIVFASSIRYTSILLIPATMAVMTLAGPMIGTLYGEKYAYGPFFLTIYVTGYLFAAFGSISVIGLLSGLGKTRVLMIQSLVALVTGLPLGVLLIPMLGIEGLIVASVTAGLTSELWGLYWVWRHYKAKADFRSSVKILAASTVASFAAYLPTVLFDTANWIKLVIALPVFLIVYVLSAPLVGAVSTTDINNLRSMSSGMGIVSKIIDIPLKAAEKVALIKTPNKNRKS